MVVQLLLLSYIILAVNGINPKIDLRNSIRKIRDVSNTIPYIENIRLDRSNIFQPIDIISKKSIDLINTGNLIPKNYEVLNVDVLKDEVMNQNLIDSKTEAIPFGLEIIIGLTSSLLLDSFLPLEVIFTAESIFLAYITFLRNVWINKPKKLEEGQYDRSWPSIWQSSLESVEDPRVWFASWFLNDIKFEDITLEDAEDFLCWAMYQNIPDAITDKERVELSKSVRQIEEFTNHKFPRRNGRAPLTSMRSSLEKFKGNHKPLAFYLITQGIFGKVMENDLKAIGFVADASIKPFRYFIKESQVREDGLHPVVFMHGVGGMPAYIKLCKSILTKISPNHPFILVEMPYVSLHVSPNVPSVDDHVGFLKEVLNKHGYKKGIFVGHSWGSNIVSWIAQSDPSIVAATIFLDPVCFMLQLRDITYNWFYRQKEDSQKTLIKSVMGLVKTETFSVNTLQRNLVWFRNIIWPHELQKQNIKTCVIVSSDDHIVPSKEIVRSIEQHNTENPNDTCIQIHQLDNADHGGMVFDEALREQTTDIIKKFIKLV